MCQRDVLAGTAIHGSELREGLASVHRQGAGLSDRACGRHGQLAADGGGPQHQG